MGASVTPDLDILWVPPADLRPNLYNPNVLDADLYAQAVESIKTYGFVDPVTVRRVDDEYVIIDGENRAKAALELGLKLVPVIVLDVDEDTAQQLTLVLNELHGRPDPAKLQRLLRTLTERHSVEELLRTLPFSRDQFVMNSAVEAVARLRPADEPELRRWVERMYRMPRDAADVLDAALARAKQYEEIEEDWKALKTLAESYLAEP